MHISIRILDKEYNMYLIINCIGSHFIYDIDEDDIIKMKNMNLLETEYKSYPPKYGYYDIH